MRNNSGFTVMELMTVIAITAIVAAVSIPNVISWRNNHQLNNSAREVMAAINGARAAAVKNNATVIVKIDPGANTVEVSYVNRATGVSSAPKRIELQPSVQVTTNFTNDSFRFNSRGLPIHINDTNFASGEVTLTNVRGTTLGVIMASTGVTRIEEKS